jgi:hypothetical protein
VVFFLSQIFSNRIEECAVLGISLIAVPVEPDALNAIMRLCLRLTRDWQLAAMFAELGGIRLLLALTQVKLQA